MTRAGGSPGAPVPARSELTLRIASAAVLSAVALLATYRGGWLFALLWLCAGVAVLVEWIAMVRAEPRAALQLILSAALVAFGAVAFALWSLPILTAIALGIVAACFGIARTARDALWSVEGFAYAAIVVVVPIVVREDPRLGLPAVLWMFAVVWTTDIAAYFVGRALGGPRLWPAVSPKKTWSGFGGGLAAGTGAGVGVAVLAARFGAPLPMGLTSLVFVTAMASILSQLGDLGESALKRRFDVKDSSHLIPGHGGVMDRLDGFWAVAAFVGAILAGAHFWRTAGSSSG